MLTVYERGNDVERMIRRCLKEMDRSGLTRELKLRAIAKPSARRKEKDRLSAQRRCKWEQKQAMWLRENSYDRNIRRQDQANRIFNARRTIDPVGRNQ